MQVKEIFLFFFLLFFLECNFCCGNIGFNFTRNPYIICYKTNGTAEIAQIFQLFLTFKVCLGYNFVGVIKGAVIREVTVGMTMNNCAV